MISSSGCSFTLRFREFRKVEAMWRQLSGSDKFRFVACVFGLPVTVFGTILLAMYDWWVNAAIQAFLAFSFSYYLYKLATGTPPQQSSNPIVSIWAIIVALLLSVFNFSLGYTDFVKHGSPPTTVNAPDTSFTERPAEHCKRL